MKSSLFTKIFNLFLFALVSFAMSASLVGPAFAQPEPVSKAIVVEASKEPPSHPNCQFSPINVVVPLGKEVDFYILNPEVGVDYTWRFDDGDTGVGKNTKHAWSALGSYKMYVTAQGDEYNNSCYTWVTVVAPELPAVTQTPPVPPVGGNTSSPAAASGSGCPSTILGDNNVVICGNTDLNNTDVAIGQKPAQPVLNQTFWQIVGQAIADLLRSFIKN